MKYIRTYTSCLTVSILFCFAFLSISHAQTVVYVDVDATGDDDGSSWDDAFVNLQDAREYAISEDIGEIWVAEGSYYPDQGSSVTSGDRTATFQLVNDVAIYGGFAGNESEREERDPESNETILSGDIGNPGFADDNSYHVVTGSNVDTTAVLDGVTVTKGNANGNGTKRHGAGMYVDGGSPTVWNVDFVDNTAQRYGGGMYNIDGSEPIVQEGAFRDNTANYGGGMYNDGSKPTVKEVNFEDNSVSEGGGGMYNFNGSNPSIDQSRFIGNTANDWGGGMSNYQGSAPAINRCYFAGNEAGNGGGAVNNNSNATVITNTVFSGNSANQGGAIRGGLETIVNSTFSGNTANGTGGAIYLGDDPDPVIYNAVLSGNSASTGDEIGGDLYGGPFMAYSLVQGGVPDGIQDGGNNVAGNPNFVDNDGQDGEVGTGDDDLRLKEGSLGIDMGSNEALDVDNDGEDDLLKDFAGNPRIYDGDGDGEGIADMGAYEKQPLAPPSNLTANVSGQQVELSWEESNTTGVEGHNIYRSTSSFSDTADAVKLNAGPVTGTAYTDTSAQSGTTYYYRVVAVDTDGNNSGLSNEAIATPGGPTVVSVEPDPVPGSSDPQPFTINGSGFEQGANVTLRDLDEGETFPNREISSFSSSEIVVNPVFTPQASTWSVEVINPDGISSGEYVFEVVTPGEFVYPVGPTVYVTEENDGDGWYNAQDFGESNPDFDGQLHLGEDWNAESGGDSDCGRSVYAAASGTIVYADNAPPSLGNVIVVRHQLPDETEVESVYAHLESMVKTNGSVEKNKKIGTIGSADGYYSSCHLHFAIRLPNSSDWGEPGPGYAGSTEGWADPSEFIDAQSVEPISFSSKLVDSDGLVDFGGTSTGINFSGVAGSGEVKVDKYENGPSNTDGIQEENVSDERIIIGVQEDLAFDNETEARFAVSGFDGINDPGNVMIYRRSDVGSGSFSELSTTYDADADELVVLTDLFGEFVLASNTEPLPVELTRFDASVENEEVLLKWQTASETNNSGFAVQRRASNSDPWTRVTFVDGAGTTGTPQTYQYRDADLPYEADSLTYRLKQMDADGSTSVSDPITVRRSAPETVQLLGTYPNPARTRATMRFALPQRQRVTVRLFDTLGRQVVTIIQGRKDEGRHQRQIDTSGLPSGVYFLRLKAGDAIQTQRLSIVR